ncbi:methyltransferase [Marinactinospora thermotolerans]|uniref:O-methyltransferase n=1 Tax=Marinactinospora thermotolerans DSM 45154 TaxID=1122192 RepID=A0A1T4NBX0_9ACTN|nr:methyltransferase [Marinactinospora thermotolerans]SJZ76772.1 O-methyltransferase [Marinactinospora thermotolerans DSM 45154]
MRGEDHPAEEKLFHLLTAPWITEAVHASIRLGVFEELAGGPRSAADLALATGSDPAAIARLLRLLGAAGLLTEDGHTAALTSAGRLLTTGHERSLLPLARFYDDACTREPWRRLEHSLRTGEPSFERVFGSTVYEHLASAPQQLALFSDAMAVGGLPARDLAHFYDFSPVRHVTDVGGGDGSLLSAILAAHPHLGGRLVELPEVAERARRLLAGPVREGRCELTPGDFFAPLPPGSDVYVLCRVLHNWNDEECVRILRNCREAMAEDGRLLIVERVIGSDPGDLLPLLFDLHMMVVMGGCERSEAQYAALLGAAGLDLRGSVRLSLGLCALVAAPLGHKPAS